MSKNKIIAIICLIGLIMQGCTRIEFCDASTHPHTGLVRFTYRWDNDTIIRPDSMIVVANRVVNAWHAIYCTTANETENYGVCRKGHLHTDRFDGDSLHVDSIDQFELKEGDYQFAAFSANNGPNDEYFTYTNLDEYGASDSIFFEDIIIAYKEYKLNHPMMNRYGQDWKDFNPYSNYIASGIDPIYVSYVSPFRINVDEEITLDFTPQPITQSIGFNFDIRHDPEVHVDSIIAEISGIPNRVNLDGSIYLAEDEEGAPYIPRTNKMLFRIDPLESDPLVDGDTITHCHGRIFVTGLVAPSSATSATGAGIMQMTIYTHMNTLGNIKERSIHSRINLYNTLNELEPKLLVKDELGRVVHGCKEALIVIEQDMHISRDLVIDNTNNDLDMDLWEQIDGEFDMDI